MAHAWFGLRNECRFRSRRRATIARGSGGKFMLRKIVFWNRTANSRKAGRKRSHWMWFVFPQLRGLGRSGMAQFYGIGSLAEARAYLAHPLLGPRLILCTRTVLAVEGRSLQAIFGSPDCATSFATGAALARRSSEKACSFGSIPSRANS